MKKIYINVFLYSIILFTIYSAVIIGFSWDEGAVVTIAKLRLKYLLSFGVNDYESLWFSRYYPGTYPVIAIFITQLFTKSYEIEVLHILNSFVGISAIFGISKIARELFNKKVGYIVFLISFFNPIFFGHMAMNERDLVIAFCNIWMSYTLIKYFKYQHIEDKRKKFIIALGILLGLGSSCRISFFATVIPIFIFLIIDSLYVKKICREKLFIKKFLRDVLVSFIIAYFVLIVFWPEVYPNILILPFTYFYETLDMSFWGVKNGLINGVFYDTFNPPANYILIFLFYKLPEYFILSYALFLIIIIKDSNFLKKSFINFYYKITLLFLIIIFPNILLLISPYPAYDNLRLFLFLIPYLSIIPGIVIFYLLENIKFKLNKMLAISLSALFIYCIYSFFSLTPYQYTYLNILSGKFSESHKKFESDYWATSIKELLKKTSFNKKDQIKLALCGMPKGRVKYYLKKFDMNNVKVVSQTDKYDYIMMTNRVYMGAENLSLNDKNLKICYDQFPGKTISSVKRKGLTISLVRSNIL